MKPKNSTRQIRALGLCSGGLDSMLSALVLKKQGIDVTWVSFETPFFSSLSSQRASRRTGIRLIVQDITPAYMEMMKAPKAGFGKNMNPCLDCHTLMFTTAGALMQEQGFDFLFSGEVLGQRPMSQTKNALRYVAKNSGFEGAVLRPLSAKCLPETRMEQEGLVDRNGLLAITGRSRKAQIQMAGEFGITDYPAPAGGCLLTDKIFSTRLRDLFNVQKTQETRQLHLLKFGRHFRLDTCCKLIVGRSEADNRHILAWHDPDQEVHLRHGELAGPDAILTGIFSREHLRKAGEIVAGYTRSKTGQPAVISLFHRGEETRITVTTPEPAGSKDLMI